jgi:hypothetical protein
MTTTDDSKLDPCVTVAIEQSAEFLADVLPDDAVDKLLGFSNGLDMFDRMLVLKRAICMVAGYRSIYNRGKHVLADDI